MWSRESEAQGSNQKTNSRNHDRGRDPPGIKTKLAFIKEKKRRANEEEIDREVGQDHPGNKRNRAFPLKIENADIMATDGDPETAAVDDQEKDGKRNGNTERLPSEVSWARFQEHSRRATETVNIPQRSISIPHFWKPALPTSSSISAVVRRRMIQRSPFRLRRTRAINSSCGCHG